MDTTLTHSGSATVAVAFAPIVPSKPGSQGFVDRLRGLLGPVSGRLCCDARRVPALPDDIVDAALMFAAESLANARQHGGLGEGSACVSIEIDLWGSELRIAVRDEGCGFEPLPAMHRAAALGTGLKRMQARLREVGGRLLLHSAPGFGTSAVAVFQLGA
jgi:signal transduction histidine kinase